VPQSRITLSVRPVLLAVPLLCAGLALAACGGGSSNASPAASQSGSASAGQQNRQRQFPGATGELAAISGSTLQVQGTSSQTAVTYTQATKISDTVAASLAAVKVGACVDARPARTAASASASTGGETPTVVAATVVVTQPVNGECAAGGGGFGGARPSGSGARPSGAPSGGQQRRGGFGANGKVVSVSGSGFVVASLRFGPQTSGSASATPATTDVTVTTSASTTYSQTVTATASALKVGTCVTAFGKADDTGSIAATAISVRPKTDGSCGLAGGGPNG
jgi:hypothetical protein